jgi:hypothetical protein
MLDCRREAKSDTVSPTIIVSNYCIFVLYNMPNVSQSRALEDVVCTAAERDDMRFASLSLNPVNVQ